MEQHSQVHRFVWQGIEIEAIYMPVRWGVIAHLEIRSIEPLRAPLPITETGYRSHFHTCGTVEANGGNVVARKSGHGWTRKRPSPNGGAMLRRADKANYSKRTAARSPRVA